MKQHTVRRVLRGAPVFRVTSEDSDNAEARFFDEIQAEINAGFPEEVNLDGPEPRRTVANTRSTSPFYRLPHDWDLPVHKPKPKPWPLIRQMPSPPKRPAACESCHLVHRGECW